MKILFAILICGLVDHSLTMHHTMYNKEKKGTYAINAIKAFSAEHSLLADHAHHADSAKSATYAEYALTSKKSEYAKDAKIATNAKNAETAHFAVCAEEAKTVMKVMPAVLQHIPTNVGGRSYKAIESKMISDAPTRNEPRRHQYKRGVSFSDDAKVVKFHTTYRKVYYNAVKADEAVFAITATSATDSGDAKTADKAVFADKALNSFNCDKADVSRNAVNAKHAENAFNALAADYARFIVKPGEKC